MAKCKYVDENQFNDFKENFHLLVETLNHNITEIKEDVNQIKISSAIMTNAYKNTNKIIWGIVGVLTTIAVGVIMAVLTKFI